LGELTQALELSKNSSDKEIENYQVILTTGEEKYPSEYSPFIKLTFSEKKKDFILKEKETKTEQKEK